EGRAEPERVQLLARGAVPELRLVAEGEERLAAAGPLAGAGELEHLVDGHVRTLAAPGRPGERAVVAHVAAQLRQWDEDLRAAGDEGPGRRRAHAARLRHQLVERRGQQVHHASLEAAAARHGPGVTCALRARARRPRTAS